jgi:hypothetical protein
MRVDTHHSLPAESLPPTPDNLHFELLHQIIPFLGGIGNLEE